MSNKGSRAERELFIKLWSKGFGVMRSPSSGSGRKHPQADLLVALNGNVLGMELKSTQSDSVYLGKDEIKKLKTFCSRFQATPIIAVRWDHHGWTFHHPRQCVETKKSYKIEKGMESIELLEREQ